MGVLIHVSGFGVRATTKELGNELALLTVETDVCNRAPVPRIVKVRTKLFAPDGSSASIEISILSAGSRQSERKH